MSFAHIIIVGASAAGISAAREIRATNKDMRITLLSDESSIPYYRPFLTEFIRNKRVTEKPNFFLNPAEWYRDNNITLRLGEKVLAIDPRNKSVATSKEPALLYDKLIFANGSSPFIPLPGSLEKSNVFAIRTYDDAVRAHEFAGGVKNAIVIGGGLLGLEAADSLSARGAAVTVIEMSPRILPRQLDAEGSGFLEDIINKKKVSLLLERCVEAIAGAERADSVVLNTGEKIQTGMIIFSIGVRPNCELAKKCGVEVNRAVVVNERMETSLLDIYACGDVAEYNKKNPCLWMPAMKQGKVAGANAAGGKSIFADELYPAVLNSFGTHVYSIGEIPNEDMEGRMEFKAIDKEKNNYKKLFFKNDRLAGFMLIGDIRDSQKLNQAMKKGMTYKETVGE